MKKHNHLSKLETLQQSLDKRFGKNLYKAAFILMLFGCLTSCQPESKEARVPTFPTTETPAPPSTTPPIKITITNTGQTATNNPLKEVYEDFPVVIDAYFAKKLKKEKENDMDSYEQIKSASLNDEVYVVVDTFNLTGKNIELKLLDKEGIITDSAYGQVNFLQDGKDVNGTYKSKVDKFNNEKENEYALFSIHLKGKDEATTADWTKKINSSKDKKLNLCLEVNVTDEEDVVYCGVNDGSTSENNRWLDQEGKWFEVKINKCFTNQIENGFLTDPKIEILKRGSTPAIDKEIKIIVLHRTHYNLKNDVKNLILNNKYPVHFWVNGNGKIFQQTSLNNMSYHIGVAQKAHTKTNKWGNSNSISIEVNGEYLDENGKRANNEVKGGYWEDVTKEQAQSVACLVSFLMKEYNLALDKVQVHEELCSKTKGEGKTVYNAMLPYL